MPLFPIEMESDRLRYERLHPDSVDPFELYEHVRVGAPAIDEISAYVSWEPYDHPKKAVDWVEKCGNQFEAGEAAIYVLRLKEGDHAGDMAGLTSLHPNWERRLGTMGIWLRKAYWGHGYSGERAARMLELAFDRLELEVVAVAHDSENEKSRQAVEKYIDRFGGHKEGRIRHDIVINGEPRDSIRYSVTRDEWKQNRG